MRRRSPFQRRRMKDLLVRSIVSRQLGQQQGFVEYQKNNQQVAGVHTSAEAWLLEKPCFALDCEGVTFANAWADSSSVDETSCLSTDFSQEDLSSSDDDVSWEWQGSQGVAQASMTRGFGY
eukprot:3185869-Amphidinium_carterae.1